MATAAADDEDPRVTERERASVQASMDVDWLASTDLSAADLRRVEPFASMTDDQAERFLATARVEHFAAESAVTERWSGSRTFYIVRAGRLAVMVGDREINVLGPGDHFGEIAAIDWGRDFSYGRTATVVAMEPTQVIAFPAAALRELMAENVALDRAVRRVAHARLEAG